MSEIMQQSLCGVLLWHQEEIKMNEKLMCAGDALGGLGGAETAVS